MGLSIIDGEGRVFPVCHLITPGETVRILREFLKIVVETFHEVFPGEKLAVMAIMADGVPGFKKGIDSFIKAVKPLNIFMHTTIV